jgi:TPR repeat protein
MVMDYIEGESYEARLRRIGTETDEASLMAVIGPVLQGLEQVHQRGLLHRDIKPDNILIKKNGQPVLIDFGAARESVGKTVTMTSIVTHGYSPIEQYQSKGRMGPWTDIYAVGAVMCRAMTGEKPPVAADRLMEDEFRPLSQRKLSGFSEAFLKAIDYALCVRPEERPQSVVEWTAILRGVPPHDPLAVHTDVETAPSTGLRSVAPDQSLPPPATSSLPLDAGTMATVPPNQRGRNAAILAAIAGLALLTAWGFFQFQKVSHQSVPMVAAASPEKSPAAALPKEAAKHGQSTAQDAPAAIPVEPTPPLYKKLIELDGGILSRNSFMAGKKVDSFAISPHETTLGDWNTILPFAKTKGYDLDADSDDGFHPSPAGMRVIYGANPKLPVTYVSWFDAVKWCNAESEQDGLTPVYYIDGEVYKSGVKHAVVKKSADGYRLPTEAEWEWAAQGGNKSRDYRYSGSDDIEQVAWFRLNAKGRPQVVGTKAANEVGLFDMSGNVMEWCAEANHEMLNAVARGGYYSGAPDMCGIRVRGQFGSDDRDQIQGFRVARNSASSEQSSEANHDKAAGGEFTENSGNRDEQSAGHLATPTNEGDFESVLREAQAGKADAQYNLSQMYNNGEAIARDLAESMRWLRKAAEQGLAAAQLDLGWMYQSGEGVAQDYERAARWYSQAAQQGLAAAQTNLGLMYQSGDGVPQDYAEALRWIRKGADQGDACGQYNLGRTYRCGLGVETNNIEAMNWYRKAAEQGDASAQNDLGWMYEQRGQADDYAEAMRLFGKAAEHGDARAQYNLGRMNESGKGVDQDNAEAMRWYRLAAAKGHQEALYKVAYGLPKAHEPPGE